jgi:hypothetical protein
MTWSCTAKGLGPTRITFVTPPRLPANPVMDSRSIAIGDISPVVVWGGSILQSEFNRTATHTDSRSELPWGGISLLPFIALLTGLGPAINLWRKGSWGMGSY